MVSLLDIIGPVMVGPSSSHTAGACRLGLLGRGLVSGTPQKAVIELHGSFARTGEGHGTDKAIVAGLMGFRPDDERIRTALQIAEQEDSVTVAYDNKPRYVFPKRDCALLPMPNTTVEMLAEYLTGQLQAALAAEGATGVTAIELEVEENFGQSATFRVRL